MTMLGTTELRTARRSLNTAIVGGGKGCESIIRMVEDDALGRFRMKVLGVAEIEADAPGVRYAREIGIPLVTRDYRELYEIPDLNLLIELTGDLAVRDEIERTRPRSVTLIDHVAARLFWNLHKAEEKIIRQRTEMRERVEVERQRIAQIFQSIPDEVLVLDDEMVIREANAAFLRNNGLEIGDVVGRHCYETDSAIRGECQVAVGNCPFFQVMQDRQTHSMVRKHFDSEGNPRFAAIVAAPVLDADGHPTGMVEMVRDITHRIQLEEELKATEVQLRQFMEMAPVAIYVKNRRGQYLEVNPAACDLLGKSKGELVGRTDREALPRELADAMATGDRDVLKHGKEVRFEGVVGEGLTAVHLSTVKYPILDASGAVTAVGGQTDDVTAQRAAETELNRTRDYLQNILDNSPVMVITTDLEGRVVSFNRGAEDSLGYRADEVIGKPASLFYEEESEREALVRRVQAEGAVRDYQTRLFKKDGTPVPVSVTLSQLKESTGRMIGTVGVCKDMSHRRALMDQIILSERLAAVGRLAAGVAHEINNPLAVIGEVTGYLTDLMEDEPDREQLMEELHNWLPKLTDQVRRGRSVTSRMLSFARKSEADVDVVDVNQALDEVLPFLEKEASLASVTLHRSYEQDLPPVKVEEMQLQEIFINLINNSIQALHESAGGNIWLTTGERSGKVLIGVEDDGPGIDPEIADRLFDPFVTTKPPGRGTGLGLSICYGVVKRYDGEILVESEPGHGAKFTVVFPAHHGEITWEFPSVSGGFAAAGEPSGDDGDADET